MSSKVVIGFLSSVLVAVVALFLVSEYKNQPELTGNESSAVSPAPHLTSAVHAHRSTSEQSDADNADHIPDKSLPIPAHQLKKLLTEKALSKEPLSDNKALNERISKLNADLSTLDKAVGRLEKSPSQATPSQVAANQSMPNPSTDNPPQDTNLADRVHHIREHLDSISQQ